MNKIITVALLLLACRPDAGERCNPLAFTNDCQPASDARLTCVYPTTPACNPSQPGSNCCGVAFCCAVDDQGNVVDTHASCKPDPAAAAACMLPLDGGASD